MTDEQPEAFRLAKYFEDVADYPQDKQAAAELRRLYAENSALAAGQCTEGGPWGDEGGTSYCKLKEINRELVEALECLLYNPYREGTYNHQICLNIAIAALAKAKGETE